jgi:hypothetical protein
MTIGTLDTLCMRNEDGAGRDDASRTTGIVGAPAGDVFAYEWFTYFDPVASFQSRWIFLRAGSNPVRSPRLTRNFGASPNIPFTFEWVSNNGTASGITFNVDWPTEVWIHNVIREGPISGIFSYHWGLEGDVYPSGYTAFPTNVINGTAFRGWGFNSSTNNQAYFMNRQNGSAPLQGRLAEFRVHNVRPSDAEINAEKAFFHSDPESMQLYWRFNEESTEAILIDSADIFDLNAPVNDTHGFDDSPFPDPVLDVALAATFLGSAEMSADITRVVPYVATFVGAGELSADLHIEKFMATTMAGAGLLDAPALVVNVPLAAQFEAAGLFVAPDLSILGPLDAEFLAAGLMVPPDLEVLRVLSAAFLGAGLLEADATVLVPLAATFQGAGALVDPDLFTAGFFDPAFFDASGRLVADLHLEKPLSATFSGAAAFLPSLSPSGIAADFLGAGELSADLTPVRNMIAEFLGSGILSANLEATYAATFLAASQLDADLTIQKFLAATFAGAGSLSADMAVTHFLAATFAGEGLIVVDLLRTMNISATCEGAGLMVADLTVVPPAGAGTTRRSAQVIDQTVLPRAGLSTQVQTIPIFGQLAVGSGWSPDDELELAVIPPGYQLTTLALAHEPLAIGPSPLGDIGAKGDLDAFLSGFDASVVGVETQSPTGVGAIAVTGQTVIILSFRNDMVLIEGAKMTLTGNAVAAPNLRAALTP